MSVRQVLILGAIFLAPWARAADALPDIEFYEKKIRPILVEHCYECHSEQKAEANLRLDLSQGWLTGGDSGPVVVPDHPEESRLVSVLRHDGNDVDMPPDGKLDSHSIQLITTWIARGAAAPTETLAPPEKTSIDIEQGRKHWAYQPIQDFAPPNLHHQAWPITSIDWWILGRLEKENLTPAPMADRNVLVRRLYFDLHGLPPEPAEMEVFLLDESPAAYEDLVDRLLASPRFGERWARHWLDIVRFGESLTLRGFVWKEAWRYRDYVIQNFNEDRPYGQFLREQIAGDLLSADSLQQHQRQLTATTFWTMGNTNLEEQDKRQLEMDVIDEQIDVMGKAFLAQTIGCARCHDHKFDPIPTRDYYALAGILRNTQLLEHANVSQWIEVPLPLPPEQELTFQEFAKRSEHLTASLKHVKDQIAKLSAKDSKGGMASRAIVDPASIKGIVVDDTQAKKVGLWTDSRSSKPFVGTGYIHDQAQGKGDKTITFAPMLPRDGRYEVRLAYTKGENRDDHVPVTVFSADGEKTIAVNMRLTPPIDGLFLSLGEYRFEVAGQSFVLIANETTTGHVIADAVVFIPMDDPETQSPATTSSPKEPTTPNAELITLEKEQKRLEKELSAVKRQLEERPAVMSIRERKEITDCPILRRGSVHHPGEVAPRGFLQVMSSNQPTPFPSSESGRRELAEWMVAEENPLTRRVWVNRIWHWLLGNGLVRTVDNFGTTGEPPSHPELLDHLARCFEREHDSTKGLIRQIVESHTYRQASLEGRETSPEDPENQLLSHFFRQRLDAESLRDAVLSLSGNLDLTMGGTVIPTGTVADYNYRSDSRRRSIYLPVFRNALPEMLTAFDFPDPSLVVGDRESSTVATQALFLMNNSFVHDQARFAARQLLVEDATEENRLQSLFMHAYGRPALAEEQELARKILAEEGVSREEAWANLLHVIMMSLDFRYVR